MTLDGTEGPDSLTGTSGDDVINGLGGDDIIDGLEGNDTLDGGADNDTVAGGAGADIVNGGDGNDTLYSGSISPFYSFPYYYGNPYTPPLLDTGSDVDTLVGGAGDDTIFAGYGDNVDGGDQDFAFDRLFISFQGASAGVHFDGHLATQTIGGGTITGIENISWVEGSNYDDYIDAGTNTYNGYSESTVVQGMGGNDTLIAGDYTGVLDGGDGNDILDGRGSFNLQQASGGAGDDILYASLNMFAVADGGAGNDTIYSAGETHGGDGNDTIVLDFSYYGINATGDAGDDVIQGSVGDEVLTGGTGADVLTGGTGYDRFIYSAGDGQDTITDIGVGDVVEVHGYAALQSMTQVGSDVVVVFGAGDQITFSNTDVATVGDALSLVDAPPPPRPTEGDDVLTGSSANDYFDGLGGNDTIAGLGGDDVLSGGDGNDTIDGGDGGDYLTGGTGADVLTGGTGYDRFIYSAGDGQDTITDIGAGDVVEVHGYAALQSMTQVGSDVVVVFGAGDQITFSNTDVATVGHALSLVDAPPPQPTEGDDVLTGSSANDYFDGLGGNDTIAGLGGDDVLGGGAGADHLDGGDGNDTLYSGSISPFYSFPYYGNPYTPPLLDTGSDVDTLVGGAGDDTIFAGYGDNVDGGDQDYQGDRLFISFQGASAGVHFDGHLATQTIGGGTITGIENISWVEGSNYDDYIDAGTNGNGYNGYSDFTVVEGMGGNDTLVASYYTGVLDGGDGNDVMDGRGSQYLQLVAGGAGDDIIYSASETHGGDGNDTIVLDFNYGINVTGDAGDDVIQGSAGGEVLSGGDGNDTIDGRDGGDYLTGGTGADVLTGGTGYDRFIYSAGDGQDTITDIGAGDVVEVHGYAALQSMTQVGSDVVVVFGAGDQITFSNTDVTTVGDALDLVDAPPPQGTEGADILTGQNRSDYIDGLGGDDTIAGRGGDDTLIGGAGADHVDGGDGNDTLYSGSISPFYSFPYYGNPYSPPLLDTGSDVDTLVGGAGSDTVFAGYGDNADGGDDLDTLLISFQGATSGVTFDASLGTQVIGGGTITGFESVAWVEGSNFDDSISLQGDFGYSSSVVFGMSGNDTLVAGYYTSLLDGGDGNDVLDGRGSFNLQQASGGAGDDIIYTNMGPNTVADGGAGDDTIYAANETHGGEGNDTIVLDFSYYGINATGDAGDDVIQGSTGDEVLSGGTGTDLLSGGGGYDRFIYSAGDGQDTITDFSAGDVVQVEGYETIQSIMQVGSDVLLILGDGDQITFQNIDVATVQAGIQLPLPADDFMVGGAEDDVLNGYGGNDIIAGGAGADIVNGGSGDDDLFSGDPDIYWNWLQPDAGLEHDVVIGGTGNDRLTIGYGDDADGGAGTDALRLSFGGASDGVTFDTGSFVPGQTFSVGGGTIQNMEVLEYVAGSEFTDQLTVAAQDGPITVDGRGGDDFITVMGGTGATVYGGADNDRVDVYGGNVTIFGGDGYDSVFVWGGTVTAYGGWADDYFVSGSGADTFFGEDGNDRISYLFSATGVTVNLSTGATPDGDQLYSIEGIDGSNYADLLTGDWQSNHLYGGNGNDTLEGLDGDDTLDGGAGNDTMRGGSGNDTYIIDSSRDVVGETADWGVDTVLTSVSFKLGENVENAAAIGSAGINLVGNALDNSLTGNDAANVLAGGAGNDILEGGGGADIMNGGVGNDIYFVDNAADKVGEDAKEGFDEVLASVSYTLASKVQVEALTAQWSGAIDLTGNEFAQTIQGNDFDNVLSGGGGDDYLIGGGGDDKLKGGTGSDYLAGGWGADSFVFGARARQRRDRGFRKRRRQDRPPRVGHRHGPGRRRGRRGRHGPPCRFEPRREAGFHDHPERRRRSGCW